jgi:hypothetical protein
VVQQRGLADAGFTRDEEDAAVSDPGTRDQALDRPTLGLAPNQHPWSLGTRWGT